MNYTLTRSHRKTIALCVLSDGSVEIRAPLGYPKEAADRLVASKARWIEKKQNLAAERLNAAYAANAARYAEGEFEAAVAGFVKLYERLLGVSVSYVGIREMATRWGSCTVKTGRIRINAALKRCPKECLEYVVVHELAHLVENNHSQRFWAIVANALPDYKAWRAELRKPQYAPVPARKE